MNARRKQRKESRPGSPTGENYRGNTQPGVELATAAALAAVTEVGGQLDVSPLAAPDIEAIDDAWDADAGDADLGESRAAPPPVRRSAPRPRAMARAGGSTSREGSSPRDGRAREPAPTLLEIDPLQYDVDSTSEPRSSQPTLPEIDPLQYDREE